VPVTLDPEQLKADPNRTPCGIGITGWKLPHNPAFDLLSSGFNRYFFGDQQRPVLLDMYRGGKVEHPFFRKNLQGGPEQPYDQ
jgi:hypothetical protein